MPMKQHESTLTIGYSGAPGGLNLLDPPNDIVYPATVYPFQRQPLYPDINEPGRSLGARFHLKDKVLLSAVRVNCPFARGLLVNQAGMVMNLYGVMGGDGAYDVENWPALRIDLSAPWGEWIPVNQFIEFLDPSPGTVYTAKAIFAYFEALTVQTKLLDPVWAGQDWKLEVDLKCIHAYPQGDPIAYPVPAKIVGVVLTPDVESILVQWTADPNAVYYEVWMQTGFEPEVLLSSPAANLYNVGFLTTGQSYTFRVVGWSFGGPGPSSDPATAVAG